MQVYSSHKYNAEQVSIVLKIYYETSILLISENIKYTCK